jgi:hypothetical protein
MRVDRRTGYGCRAVSFVPDAASSAHKGRRGIAPHRTGRHMHWIA